MRNEPNELSPATLARPLRGARLDGIQTLGDLVQEATFLAFLRHNG